MSEKVSEEAVLADNVVGMRYLAQMASSVYAKTLKLDPARPNPLIQRLKTIIFDAAMEEERGTDPCTKFQRTCAATLGTSSLLLGLNLAFLKQHCAKGFSEQDLLQHWRSRPPADLTRLDMSTQQKRNEALWVECITHLYVMGVAEAASKLLKPNMSMAEVGALFTSPETTQHLDDAGWQCTAECFRRAPQYTCMRFLMHYYCKEAPNAGTEKCHEAFLRSVVGTSLTAADTLHYLYGRWGMARKL
jgi:hypothetical protein